MTLRPRLWALFTGLAALSFLIWFQFTSGQLSVVNLSVDRPAALGIARDYLKTHLGPAVSDYKTAVIFTTEYEADQYLQKTIGFDLEQKFFRKYDFDLFFWLIRFFKEGGKEEYRLTVSSKTGAVIAFSHTRDESAGNPDYGQEAAKQAAIEFLSRQFGFNPQQYSLITNLTQELDNRIDYHFVWQKNGVYIPWSDEENSGGAKLLTSATVSGKTLSAFSKNTFILPDQYNRFKEKQMKTGALLSSIFRIFYLLILTSATYFVIRRRHHLAMQRVKNFYIGLMAVLFFATLLDSLNQFERLLFNYETTTSLTEYLLNHGLNEVLIAFMTTVGFLMFALGGEALRQEVLPDKREGGFLYYLRTTFLSRNVFEMICLGYPVFFIMLGLQALAFKFGEQNFQLWIEHSRLVQLSTNYFPFVAAFIIGLKSSFIEEITYRLYAISWGKLIFRRGFGAVIFAAFIWGLAHSGYYIFPMWFRVLEIGALGVFLAAVYLKFGIIPVIVAHFLFDVFWNTAEFLFGHSQPADVLKAQFLLLLPFLLGLVTFFMNKKTTETPLNWQLNTHQHFNLDVLKTYLRQTDLWKRKSEKELTAELLKHGWDMAVVETALRELSEK